MRHMTRAEMDLVYNHVLGERLPGAQEHEFFKEYAAPRYKIGCRRISPGGLVWHYARAGAFGIEGDNRRRAVLSSVPGISETNYVTIGITPIGGTQVVINDVDPDHGVDYWANGKASMFPTAPDYSNDQSRIVKSSTASTGAGGQVILTLYQPVYYAIPNGADVYMCPCPYSQVDQPSLTPTPQYGSMVGYSWMPVTTLYYFWCQTWGLCQPTADAGDLGIASGNREVYFNPANGTILSGNAIDGSMAAHQRAGYLVPRTIMGAGGDESYLMLQLDP